jgi:hypothetical protein
MATDWCRAELQNDADTASLGRLIEQQASASQSIWGWQTSDLVGADLAFRLHGERFRSATRELREAFIFPGWDAEHACPHDIPLLDNRRRVTAIAQNPLFPPLWRCRAYRTFLPNSLGTRLSQWTSWADQVAGGAHDEYVQELHLHATCRVMKGHWSDLRHLAIGALARSAAWASSHDLRELRDAILRLPEPGIEAIRLDPSDPALPGQADIAARQETALAQVKTLVALTSAWDAQVPGNKKLGYTERHYDVTIEQFRSRGRATQLRDFLDWARQCQQRGFALFLD